MQKCILGAIAFVGFSLTSSLMVLSVFLTDHPSQTVDLRISHTARQSRQVSSHRGHDNLRPMSPKPIMRSPDQHLASVRIGDGGGCSGTIIAIKGKYAYGISAAHCCGGIDSTFVFGNPDSTEGNARWIAVNRTLDLALFRCWSEDVRGLVCVPDKLVPDWTLRVEALGYPHTDGPKQKFLKYNRTHGHGEEGSKKYFKNRYCFDNLGPGVFGSGDSGGGVFYDGPCLIGVMTHGDDIHAASLPQIVSFIKTNEKVLHGAKPFR